MTGTSRRGNLLGTGGADAVDALLIFFEPAEADAQLSPSSACEDSLLDAPQPGIRSPSFNVGLRHCRCFILFAAD